jgi:acyl-CoA synthetase (NDP forming)
MSADETATSVRLLGPLLSPKVVAVVGANDEENRIGGRVLARMREYFPGRLIPINPSRPVVQGLEAFPSLTDLDVVPDLVIIAVPSAAVPGVVEECAARHVPAAIILSSGFGEAGAEGVAVQARMCAVAAAGGTRLIGPNSLGVINVQAGLVGTFSPVTTALVPGRIAVISQSGGVGSSIFRELQRNGVGAGLYFATGNEADVTASEVVEDVVEDPEIDVVLVCIEGGKQPERFVRAARRAAKLGKSILMLKMGSSEAGARGAKGHTGAVSSDEDAFRAALQAAGVVFVKNPMALVDHARSFVDARRPAGSRIGIITVSGGMGVHLSDIASERGLEVPALSESEQARFLEWLPGFGGATNPIDLTAQSITDGAIFPNVLAQMAGSDSIDSIVLYATETGQNHEVFDAIEKGNLSIQKPFLVVVKTREEVYDLLGRGVPAVADPARAVDVIYSMAEHARRDVATLRRSEPTPGLGALDARPAAGLLNQQDTFALLDAYGVPCAGFAVADSPEGAAEAAGRTGFPVALKLEAPGLVHKSDLGGVILGLQDAEAVEEAAIRLQQIAKRQEIDATFLLQEMVPSGIELFCGLRRNAELGVVLVVGLGGHLVEIMAEARTLMARQTDREIEWALRQLCGGRLVSHYRGLSPEALRAVVHAVGRVATLGVSVPEIEELDLNPLVITGDRVVAIDASCHVSAG